MGILQSDRVMVSDEGIIAQTGGEVGPVFFELGSDEAAGLSDVCGNVPACYDIPCHSSVDQDPGVWCLAPCIG